MKSESLMMAKIVRSGDTVEYYWYSDPIPCGRERGYDIIRSASNDEDDERGKRSDNLYRARQTVRRLIWANQTPYTKFVTLTYADTVLDVKKVQRHITTFVQRMRRNGFDMRYIYVLEHQKERGVKEGNEGCIHVHMVLFNDAYIPADTLSKLWGHGFVKINAIDDVRNVGAYVCKYITKDTVAAFGRQSYACSQNLNKPLVERIYVEGLGDTTTGLHPTTVYNQLDVSYYSSVQHDYRDAEGCVRSQTVFYSQGAWKNADIIEANNDE